MTTDLPCSAEQFARTRHAGHVRKYTGEPYTVHLREVAELVASVGGDPVQVAAAWLHDVVEDTATTIEEVRAAFGDDVGDLVADLTDISQPSDGNRQARKALDRDHLAAAPARSQTIKLADLISNTQSIAAHDPGFARVYLAEKRALLDVLVHGDATLHALVSMDIDFDPPVAIYGSSSIHVGLNA